MYIGFMSILPIVVEYLKFLRKMSTKIFSVIMVMLILQANRKFAHVLMSKVGQWKKNWVSWRKATEDMPQNQFMIRMYICSKRYFDFPLYNETIFSSSYFHEGPIVNVESIEESLGEIILHRVQKKETNYCPKNLTKIEQFNKKRGKQNYPISYPQIWWRYVRLEMNVLMTHL